MAGDHRGVDVFHSKYEPHGITAAHDTVMNYNV